MTAFKKILVPTDFGPSSRRATEVAVDMAERYGAALVLLHVWDAPSYAYAGMEFAASELLTPIRERAHARLEQELAAVRERLPRTQGLLRCGEAWQTISDAILALEPDLVVMGTRGRRGVARAILGSVAEKVVRTSPVAVLTVHAGPERPGAVMHS